jgi:Asp-tRNA(Asn)/Glu-tRNA(Gln) amidotransferase A subunit family amidase
MRWLRLQGAIIVARGKSSQFANGESATADWVDQMCPFNPRGDGYQQPSSSSSGPGAAIAAYDWIDNTVGSDTGGSITGPASVNGIYGMRPTWNAINLTGVIPLQPTQDTAGFFARDAVTAATFSRGWYGDRFGNYTQLPKVIDPVPRWSDQADSNVQTLIFPNSSWTFEAGYTGTAQFNAFRQALTSYVNPTTIDTRDFDGFWNDTGRFAQFGNETTNTYMAKVYGSLIGYYQWFNFAVPWISDYQTINDGRIPFIDPSPLVRWDYGRFNVTAADFNASMAKKEVWGDFINTAVLPPDNTTCTEAIYVIPFTLGSVSYRVNWSITSACYC